MHNDPMKDDTLRSTEYFSGLVQKPRKGNLKIYMTRIPRPRLFDGIVSEGRRLLSSGLDAAVALDGERTDVDFPVTHLVLPKEVSFKKSKFLEMDYEAILRRSPEVVIIDNLLHVNISVSANEMRYHDVRDLLDHGISVITSAYSAFGNHLKTALDYVSGSFSVPFERWANLPTDEIVTLVFSPKETFHHAEVRTPALGNSIQ
jgi:two-component system sensor histidine kinase KdpD